MTTEENLLDEKENQVNPQKKTQKSDPKDDKILELEKALAEQTDIAKRAQYDLVTQRFDFERHQAMLKEQEKSMDVDILISTVKKLLPFVENLRKSLDVLSDEQKEESLAKGLQMTYDNFLKVLEGMSIKPIISIGFVPDTLLHEPVGVEPTDDKKMKGKIIKEFERGFFYEKDGNKKVIITSKVVVGE